MTAHEDDSLLIAILLTDHRVHEYFGKAFTVKFVALRCLLNEECYADAARSHNCTRHAVTKQARRARKIFFSGGKSTPVDSPQSAE